MEAIFADQLCDRVRALRAPVCVGIDLMLDQLPDKLARDARSSGDPSEIIEAFAKFGQAVLEILAPLVPVVKLQSAYFERYRADGVREYFSLIDDARDLGLLTIGDVKRGDIGSTSEAYAMGHLASIDDDEEDADLADTPDAITVNPMLGIDTLEPFLDVARMERKGLFVLVRTSNPGSAALQDVQLADGRTWSEALADLLRPVTEQTEFLGTSGLSSIGAVVGATQAHTMASLRQRLPKSVFLLPGYGTQGATADMTRSAFIGQGLGAIVSASRSVLYPKSGRNDWKSNIRDAVKAMVEDIRAISGI
jgi:orotidine-5'-phosphate decarboxylase